MVPQVIIKLLIGENSKAGAKKDKVDYSTYKWRMEQTITHRLKYNF